MLFSSWTITASLFECYLHLTLNSTCCYQTSFPKHSSDPIKTHSIFPPDCHLNEKLIQYMTQPIFLSPSPHYSVMQTLCSIQTSWLPVGFIGLFFVLFPLSEAIPNHLSLLCKAFRNLLAFWDSGQNLLLPWKHPCVNFSLIPRVT